MGILEDSFNGLNNVWSTYRVVHERVGLWAPITIQHSLRILAKAGLIEQRMVPAHPFSTLEYRLKPHPVLTEQKLLSAIKELSRRKPLCPVSSPAVVPAAVAVAPSTLPTISSARAIGTPSPLLPVLLPVR